MKQRQGGFLISKIKQIGGRRFDKILQEKNIDAYLIWHMILSLARLFFHPSGKLLFIVLSFSYTS